MLVDPVLIQMSDAFFSSRVLIPEHLFAWLASDLAFGELCMLECHPVIVLLVAKKDC